MTQQSNTLNFVIHDVNGQPQVIKVVQSPTANKHSQLTGQTVKAIIKTPSHDNQTNVLQGSGQVIRTLTLQPQKNTSGQRVLTIPIGSAGGPQSNTNLKVQTIKAGEHHTILPKTLHLASSSLVLGSGQRLTSSPSVITTSGTGSATPRITSVTSATQSNLTTVATANLNSNNSNNNNSSIINNTNSFISPILDHTGGSRKRHDIEADYVPEYTSIKRRKTEKVGKGLRHFSMKVCEKVRKKGTTSYNEVADELVQEFTNPLSAGSPTDQQYDQKNIRRRVYDALNVLMAMNIISKEKKEIRWLGLPTNSLQECKNLEKDCQKRVESIKHKTQQLQDLIVQQISFKNLVERNRSREKLMGSSPMPNSTIQLPFIIVNTNKKTVIDCSIANDKTEYQFNFNDKFEIHDDIEVLKRMGMDFGLDKGECTYEDLQKAKSMVPKSLEHYVEQLAHGSIDILPAGFELSTGVSEPSCSSTSGMNMTMTVEEVEATLTHNDVSRQSSHTSLSDPLSPSIHEFSEEEEEDDSDLSSELEVN